MTPITLTQSKVTFMEEPHGYHLGNKRLSGITTLLHDVLKLGVYPNASDYVKAVAIPRAGEYGHAVHKAIETYEDLDIKMTSFPNTFDGGEWNVAAELDGYIRHRSGFRSIATEYTISDNRKWASNIDNVWQKKETEGLWLVDTKTNNLMYYPGGEFALKEYLSWQLSIYAYLFERQNKGLKVEGLACNYLRGEKNDFWNIDRKPDTLVETLLEHTICTENEDGTFTYSCLYADRLQQAVQTTPPVQLIVPEDTIMAVYDVKQRYEQAKAELDKLATALRAAMEVNNMKSWDSGYFKATIATDSVRETFDTKKFKADHPELAEQYITKKAVKGGFTIKLRDL